MSFDAERHVRAFCDSWASGDVDRIQSFLADDVEWENVPIGILRGREAARARIAAACAAASAIAWQVTACARTGDGALLTERIDRITLPGGTVVLRLMGLFRADAGGIRLWRDYFDGSHYRDQLARCGGRGLTA